MNLILSGSHERVYSSGAGVEVVQLGLYIIRGDNMYALANIKKISSSGLPALVLDHLHQESFSGCFFPFLKLELPVSD